MGRCTSEERGDGAGAGLPPPSNPDINNLDSIKRFSHKPLPHSFFEVRNQVERKDDLRRWEYDSPIFRNAFNSGNFNLNIDDAVANFFGWLSTDVQLTFENKKTGEVIQSLGSKRGNKQFARKKWKRVKAINEGMNKLQFDFDIPLYRGIYKNGHLLLITLTFNHEVSMEDAWFHISSHGKELNRFKANLTKILGSKATVNTKEAQSNGYPAPHILVLLDKPVKAKRHYGKSRNSWRLEQKDILQRIKNAWRWGFVDVEVVTTSSNGKYRGYRTPVSYLSKYLTKHMDLSKHPELLKLKSASEIPKDLKAAVYTHVWNKILRSSDFYVSKAFKERLNLPNFTVNEEQSTKESEWLLMDVELHSPLDCSPFQHIDNVGFG